MADIGPTTVGKLPAANANSPNHDGLGQNVLYADGSVEFRTTPLAGVEDDHIYRTRLNSIFDSPQDATDSILLPIQQ
jgi:prepilin-type processing-associated H-X9-DG protein